MPHLAIPPIGLSVCCAVVALLFAGCDSVTAPSHAAAADEPTTPTVKGVSDDPTVNRLDLTRGLVGLAEIGWSQDRIVAMLSEPDRSKETTLNGNPVTVLAYDDISLVLTFSEDELWGLWMADARFQTPDGVGIGITLADLAKTMGQDDAPPRVDRWQYMIQGATGVFPYETGSRHTYNGWVYRTTELMVKFYSTINALPQPEDRIQVISLHKRVE